MQSSFFKITIILLIVVTLGGGAVWWYLSGSHSPSQSNTQNPSGNLPGVPQTTTTGSSAQTATSSQTTSTGLDIIALFKKLNAQQVLFTSASATSTGNVANLYKLYASDVAESKKLYPSVTYSTIDIGAVDLNNDGTPEAFVYENLLGFCGSGGCSVDIYQLKKGVWVKISSLLGSEDLGISNTSTKGFNDLFLTVHGDIGAQSQVMRYVWDGTTYQPGTPVATWNGASYNLTQ